MRVDGAQIDPNGTLRGSSSMTPTGYDIRQAQAFGIRIWLACLTTQELLCTYLGVRLGLYERLSSGGPMTVGQLAARAELAPRYIQEWLEQQAVAGIVTVDDASRSAEERLYRLPAAHAEVLRMSNSLLSRAASVLPVGGVAQALPALLSAYRTGAGVSDAQFGEDWRMGHADGNRAVYAHLLVPWLRRALPELHSILGSPGAQAVDMACGAGWAGIALALAYPTLRVRGVDIDAALVADARAHAASSGMGDRMSFVCGDASAPGSGVGAASEQGRFDLVCLFDALHELPRPVEMLQACRALRSNRGYVLVMDARVQERFVAPGDEIERFQYTTSVLHCLPACLAEQPSAGTGTAMRLTTVRKYAHAAGFTSVQIISSEDRFHFFYLLTG